MSDSKDLEEMAELISVLSEIQHSDCMNCPLSYIHYINDIRIDDECDMLSWEVSSSLDVDRFPCDRILKKKVDEITTYIFERSLKDG